MIEKEQLTLGSHIITNISLLSISVILFIVSIFWVIGCAYIQDTPRWMIFPGIACVIASLMLVKINIDENKQ